LVHSILCYGWGGVFFLAHPAVVTFSEAFRRKITLEAQYRFYTASINR